MNAGQAIGSTQRGLTLRLAILAAACLNGCYARTIPPTPAEIEASRLIGYYILAALICVIVSPFVLTVAVKWSAARTRHRRRFVQQFAGDREHPGFAGEMLELLYGKDRGVWDLAASALKHVLPQITESDVHLFDPRHRALLRRTLDHQDGTLVVAALAALSQIGDERDMSVTQRLLTHSSDMAVVNAANRCSAAIDERLKAARSHDTLLRASNGADDSLLRAARSTVDSPQDALLRMTDGE